MKFSASKALTDSFSIFGGRFVSMLPIAILFTAIPLILFMATFGGVLAGFSQNQGNPAAAMQTFLAMFGTFALAGIVYALVRIAGICALCVSAAAREPITVGEAVSEGLRVTLPMVGVYLVLMVAYFAVAAVLMLTMGASFIGMMGSGYASGQGAPGAGSIGTMILVICLVLIGLVYLMTKLSMVVPVVAVDKERSPFAAISRSWGLTRGATLKIFLLFLLTGFGAAIIGGVLGGVIGGASVAAAGASAASSWPQLAVSALTGTLFSIYFIALIVAIHGQLAGPSVAAIGETFD